MVGAIRFVTQATKHFTLSREVIRKLKKNQFSLSKLLKL